MNSYQQSNQSYFDREASRHFHEEEDIGDDFEPVRNNDQLKDDTVADKRLKQDTAEIKTANIKNKYVTRHGEITRRKKKHSRKGHPLFIPKEENKKKIESQQKHIRQELKDQGIKDPNQWPDTFKRY